jgi:hypothetical protein
MQGRNDKSPLQQRGRSGKSQSEAAMNVPKRRRTSHPAGDRGDRTLPGTNSSPFERELTQVDQNSVYDCILHFSAGQGHSSYDHLVIGGLRAAISLGEPGKFVSLRKIIQFAGHGFSTLYKHWPRAEDIFKDIWLFSIECYMASELEHLRQLGNKSPSSFIETLAAHIVFSQNCIPTPGFRFVLKNFYGNDVTRMMSHIPGHLDNILKLYEGYFKDDPRASRITYDLRKEAINSAYLLTTSLFLRNTSPKVRLSDAETIESVKSFMFPYLGGT